MPESNACAWRRIAALLTLFALSLLAACGGGNTNISNAPTGLEAGNATDLKTVLQKADILLLLVDHAEFLDLDRELIKDKVVIDTKGVWR